MPQRTHIFLVCVSLCFIPGTLKFGRPKLYMDNFLVYNVSECKYLGAITRQKNCDLDITRQIGKCYANVNMLLERFSKFSTPMKCCLFKTYCSSLYCAPLWYNTTVTAIKKLLITTTALDD